MRTIAIINQKGGCGKTTVAINLSAVMAHQGHRTLLVDMDPQSHCAVGLAIPEEQIEKSVYDLLISGSSDSSTELKQVVWQIAPNFDLAPSNIELAALDPQLAGQDGREECLRTALSQHRHEYDYAILDCPPGVGLLSFNALRAADEVVIPVETGYFALHGLGRELETLSVLEQQCNQKISFHVLASMYDVRTKLAREVLSELRANYGRHMFKSVVNFNTKLKEAASFGQAITEYDPASKGMKDFVALSEEIHTHSKMLPASLERLASATSELAAISQSADELLRESRRMIGVKPTISDKRIETVEEKIEKFYGVRDNNGKVTFAVLYPNARTVQLAGEFNDWHPEETPLQQSSENGRWNIELELNEGAYQYRYVVDGRWQPDPYNSKVVQNEFGEENSLLQVDRNASLVTA